MTEDQVRTLRFLCQQMTEDEAQEVAAYWLAYTDRNSALLLELADTIGQADAQAVVDH
jgi:hypothetical protein